MVRVRSVRGQPTTPRFIGLVLAMAASAALVAASLLGASTKVSAQSPEQFYKGKTVEFLIGYAPGGSNDAYSRLIATHIGKHIPGNPSVVPRNMPGAGSFLAVNRIYATAPK